MAQPPLRLISAAQLRELPGTEYIGTTKFVAGGLNVVFGPSGAYKSFLTLDAALRIAQSKPVVYIAAEGVGGLHRRVEAWCEHNKLNAGLSYFLDREVNLLDLAEVKLLAQSANDVKPQMVVFDTLARCIPGGDENSAKDMGIAVRSARFLQRHLNTAVSWVHHSNRAEKGERGSGALRGAADSMIEVFPNGDGSIKVSCSKTKDEEPWAEQQYRFLPVGETKSGVLVPSVGYAVMEYSEQEYRILDFLALDTFTTSGARVAQIVNALNIPERTIYRLLSHLKREGQIKHGRRGDPFFLSEGGKDTLLSAGKLSATDTEVAEIEFEQ